MKEETERAIKESLAKLNAPDYSSLIQDRMKPLQEALKKIDAEIKLPFQGVAEKLITTPSIPNLVLNFSNIFEKLSIAFEGLDEEDWDVFLKEFGWLETFPATFAQELKDILIEKGKGAVWEELIKIFEGKNAKEYFDEYYPNMNLISHRITILNLAFRHHTGKDYFSSIPLFLSQIEGILWDIATKKGLVKKNEEYKIDITGNYVLDRNGKKIKWNMGQLIGAVFDTKSNFSKKWKEDIYTKEFRHPILHGRDINYANSEREITLILFLFVLLEKIKIENL